MPVHVIERASRNRGGRYREVTLAEEPLQVASVLVAREPDLATRLVVDARVPPHESSRRVSAARRARAARLCLDGAKAAALQRAEQVESVTHPAYLGAAGSWAARPCACGAESRRWR
ncbi:hypothetical protein ACFPRL_02095 [Pseudoclavibacter helvolus]